MNNALKSKLISADVKPLLELSESNNNSFCHVY